MKIQHNDRAIPFMPMLATAIREERKYITRRLIEHDSGGQWPPVAPHQPGDILYITEEHYAYGHWEKNGKFRKSGHEQWAFRADDRYPVYFNDNLPKFTIEPLVMKSMNKAAPQLPGWYKRIGRFMKRDYARTRIRITAVRSERLQELTEADAIAEGIEAVAGGYRNYWLDSKTVELMPQSQRSPHFDPILSFRSLWSTVHPGHDWPTNPWLWVYSFEKVDG